MHGLQSTTLVFGGRGGEQLLIDALLDREFCWSLLPMCGGAGWADGGWLGVGSTWGVSLSSRNGSTQRGPEQRRNLQVLEAGSRNGGQERRLEALARGSCWPRSTEIAWLLRSPKHRLGISGTSVCLTLFHSCKRAFCRAAA